jgi:hypothetical protein
MSAVLTSAMPAMGATPPINLHTILTDWQTGPFPIGVAAALIAMAVWYLQRVRRVAPSRSSPV